MQKYRERLFALFSARQIWLRLLISGIVLLAIVYLWFVFSTDANHDEVEHAHVAYKILSGEVPYRDFYQNHWPLYWLLNAQFVRTFPFSIHSILAVRGLNILVLVGCWLLGLRLLGCVRGGRTWLGLSIYTCAMLSLACQMEIHQARPDPIMVLFGTAGFCLVPARGNITNGRALILGVLFGLSASISNKVIPIALVVPALIIIRCIRDRRFQPATALCTYGVGVCLGLLSTALWVFRHGLFKAFCFDVFSLNNALSKRWFLSLRLLIIPVFIPSALGALALTWQSDRRLKNSANGPLIVSLTLVAGLLLAFMSRHPARYNLMILMVPMSVGFASFVLYLFLRTRSLICQLFLCAALLGYPTLCNASTLLNIRVDSGMIPLRDLQRIMDLAKPGNRSCIAFSPAHPVFCHDVSGLSNGWDMSFVENIRDPRQIERFRKLWHDGIQLTLAKRPDIILRRSSMDIWERAVKAGLVSRQELDALDALRPDYEARCIGHCEVWIRQSQ
jgi:hypothetical protein